MVDKQHQTGKLAAITSLIQQLMQRTGNVSAAKTKESFNSYQKEPIVLEHTQARSKARYRL